MTKEEFETGKTAIKASLAEYLDGRREIGLTDVKRHLSNDGSCCTELAENGLFVAKMLNACGWRRDGQLYTGYDRTPRYAPVPA